MKNILQLNSYAKHIDLNKIKKSIEIKHKYRPYQKKHFEEDQEVVYTILHEFSNYDEVIWSLYKTNNRKLIHNQLQFILVEISKLDSSLTWTCRKILKRYKNQYNQRKLRNSFVNTPSLALG